MKSLELEISPKQKAFIDAEEDEVLFGGAAGGGKSYGQLLDAFRYAIQYPGSKQLLLRRTFPELERSLILVALGLYPKEIYKYNGTNHRGTFKNGSIIEFGYCNAETDVYQYQSAEYDVIRFDELTHFTETMYTYLISRLRGSKPFPRSVKSSTNPGGVGHAWVKKRFIDPSPPNETFYVDGRSRIFIPSLLQDNQYLMEADAKYAERLKNLGETDYRMLALGDWDVAEGQYFTEFDRQIHVMRPFRIPSHWVRYRTIDYGLDAVACYWIAMDEQRRAYVYKEMYDSGVIISAAANRITEMTDESIAATYAPPDLWNRRQETGKSVFDIFAENRVYLIKASNNRVQGWYDLKEWLKPFKDEMGVDIAGLRIFENCVHLIESLPALQISQNNPNDCATEPHEYTHAPDAIRYFISGRPAPTKAKDVEHEERIARRRSGLSGFLHFGGR